MHKPKLRHRIVVTAATVAAVAAGGTATALATDSSSANVYQACLNHTTGMLYKVKVNPLVPPKCTSPDTVITWNQTGPAGPQGLKGDTGAQGETGPQGDKGETGTGVQDAQWYVDVQSVDAHGTLNGAGYCRNGGSVISGGISVINGDAQSLTTYESNPTNDLGGWHFHFGDTGDSSVTVRLWFLCVPVTLAPAVPL